MSRTNKKSRIKGLPPRILQQTKDAHTGSFPAKLRCASDNRTGKYNIAWDDTQALVFTSSRREGFSYGANVPESLLNKESYQLLGQDFSSSMVVPAPFKKKPLDLKYDPIALWVLDGDLSEEVGVVGYLTSSGIAAFDDGPFEGVQAFTTQDELLPYLYRLDSRLHVTGAMTIEFFYYPFSSDANDTDYDYLYGWSTTDTTPDNEAENAHTLRIKHSDKSFLVQHHSGSPDVNQFAFFYNTGYEFDTWNHIALVRDIIAEEWTTDNTSLKIYVNGILQGEEFVDQFSGGSGGLLRIMNAFNLSSVRAGGRISSFKMFDKALTSEQIFEEFERLHITNNSRVVSGIADQFVSFTPGQTIEPFKDHSNPAVDGKSNGNNFYATGSKIEDVGEGLSQPLWAKSKIEIDLTPGQKCSIRMNDGTGPDNSYPMAYWNDDAKLWHGIGTGKQWYTNYSSSSLDDGLRPFLEETCIGFSNSSMRQVGTASVETTQILSGAIARARPINNFGFPYHQKFHATSSNCIEIEDYINAPFLLEKAVLIVSATVDAGSGALEAPWPPGLNLSDSGELAITSFFLLNQRDNVARKAPTIQKIHSGTMSASNHLVSLSMDFTVPSSSHVDSETGKVITSTRDLLTYFQVSSIDEDRVNFAVPNSSSLFREHTIIGPVPGAHNWSLNLSLSASMKNPIKYNGDRMFIYYNNSSHPQPVTGGVSFFQDGLSNFRNGTKLSGRSLLSEYSRPELLFSTNSLGGKYDVFADEEGRPNPYLLLPKDKLILGCQLPMPSALTIGQGGEAYPTMSGSGFGIEWDTTPQKIVLYGSYIKENKEHHDTLNQLLTNNVVHEVIGDD